jgi:hypothetical protein
MSTVRVRVQKYTKATTFQIYENNHIILLAIWLRREKNRDSPYIIVPLIQSLPPT